MIKLLGRRIMGGGRGEDFQEHVQRTRGQNPGEAGSRVGSGDGWGGGRDGGKMATTVLEQQLNKNNKNCIKEG